ncbi:MAG: glycosyltransferase family 2 protein [Bacteriovoracaceae bacterium]|nr:glycosyltransferase family 2 protein [Bacteriovoracaceae bacterium]
MKNIQWFPPTSSVSAPKLLIPWNKGSLAVVMPTYNEKEALPQVLNEWTEELLKMNIHLILVNDGSKDETLSIMKDWQLKFPNVGIIDKPNSGHGPTCLVAYEELIKSYDVIFQTDSDGQIKYQDFYKGLLQFSQTSRPFLIGKRNFRGDGFRRTIISLVLNYSITIIFGKKIPDANVPFRFMLSKALKKYLDFIPSNFFLANALLASLQEMRSAAEWMPVPFYDRVGGQPSVKFSRFGQIGKRIFGDFYRFKVEHRFFFE